jgi:uncharacterized HAD superfamily protein
MAIIGFDIDDTIADGISVFLPIQNSYFGKNVTIDQMNRPLHDLYGVTKTELHKYFVDSGPEVLPLLKPLPYAVEMINYLYEEGHTIYFLTARPKFNTEKLTIDWLDKYGFKYDGIRFDGNKVKHAKQLGIEIFVDDMNYIVENMKKNKIDSIFVASPKNEKVKTSNGIYRAKNCKEIFLYIKEIVSSY